MGLTSVYKYNILPGYPASLGFLPSLPFSIPPTLRPSLPYSIHPSVSPPFFTLHPSLPPSLPRPYSLLHLHPLARHLLTPPSFLPSSSLTPTLVLPPVSPPPSFLLPPPSLPAPYSSLPPSLASCSPLKLPIRAEWWLRV